MPSLICYLVYNHANADFCARFPKGSAEEGVYEPEVVQIQKLYTVLDPKTITKETLRDEETALLLRHLIGTQNPGYDTTIVTRQITPRAPRNGQNETTSQKLRLLERNRSGIENVAKNCRNCVQNAKQILNVAVHPWEFPRAPWQRIHIDFDIDIDISQHRLGNLSVMNKQLNQQLCDHWGRNPVQL
ncbi:hypothetical protein QE152_g24557 [Popillia japonica]|uniref:HNH nuclease domain-containing protein n=1 Tax=Popillia japonica TaxID=7064 RepID=A0AAW1KED9_POPJA